MSPGASLSLPKRFSKSAVRAGSRRWRTRFACAKTCDTILPELRAAGLNAIEAYHSDHSPAQTEQYLQLAAQHGLLVTGGSDFHGAVKPEIHLGTGRGGNLKVPEDVVDRLKAGLRAG